MKYTYRCPQCQSTKTVEMSVTEHDAYDAICKNCKVKQERIYEMPRVKGSAAGDVTGQNNDTGSGCSGACGSCTACGCH